MKNFLKFLGIATVLVLGVMAVSYLQYRFDRSDIQHAVDAVRMTRPTGHQGPTLEEILSGHYGVPRERIFWVPTIESKVKGTVKVKASVPGSKDLLEWRVDLVRFQVQPLSTAAQNLPQGETPAGASK